MRRILGRTFPLLILMVFASCECAPPAASGGDAGATDDDDAGATAPTDAGGEALGPTGRALVQLPNGTVAEVDLEDGSVRWPLGRGASVGGVTLHDGALYVFSPSARSDGTVGNIARVLLTDRSFTNFASGQAYPRGLATNGDDVVLVAALYDGIEMAPLSADVLLESPALDYSATAAVYTDDGLVVSTFEGTGPYGESKEIAAICRGLDVTATGELLCARADGSAVVRIDEAGDETVVQSLGGVTLQSVTALADGGFVATRDDCGVVSSRALPDLSALCPVNFVEHDGTLYAGLRDGGVVAIDAGGAVSLFLLGASKPGGVAVRDGRVAVVGGEWDDHAFVTGLAYDEPRLLTPFGTTLGAAFGDDGELWVLDTESLTRTPADAGTPVAVHDNDGRWRGIARVGDAVYLLAGASVERVSLDAGPTFTPETLVDVEAALIAGCDERALLYVATADEVISLSPEGATTVELASASEAIGGAIDAIGCAHGHVLLSENGRVHARKLGSDDDLVQLADVGARLVHIAALE